MVVPLCGQTLADARGRSTLARGGARAGRIALGLTLLWLSPAAAQDPSQGAVSPAAPATPAAQPAPSTGAKSGGGFSGGDAGGGPGAGASPESLFGLAPTDSPRTISLDEALAKVARDNFDLRIAAERMVQARANVRRAWALVLPKVNVGGGYTFNYPEQTVAFGDEEQFRQQALLYDSLAASIEQTAALQRDAQERQASIERAERLRQVARQLEQKKAEDIVVTPTHQLVGQATVTMPIFSGRTIPAIKNAYEAVDISRLSAAQARAQLMHSTARAYFGAVTAKSVVDISREQLDNSLKHQQLVADRYELGLTTELSVQRAALDVARSRQQLRSAENVYAVTIGLLGLLIDEHTTFEVRRPPPQPALEEGADVEALIARALAARPEIALQRAALAMADNARLDAWMMFLPSLGVTAQGRYNSNTAGFTPQPFTGAVMLQASIPIYDGGARYAALTESGSKVREELLRIRQLQRRIENQVRGNRADVLVKKQALEMARKTVALARETQANAQTLFDAGLATDLDVIDANLATTSLELEVARAELELEKARMGLAFVVGAFPGDVEDLPRALDDDEGRAARALVGD